MMLRFFTLFGLLLLLACASPLKKYNNQDYNGAAKAALKNLQKGKAVNQSENILEKSMLRIIEDNAQSIAESRNSEDISDWEKALRQSEKLQEKILAVEPYLGNLFAEDMDRLSEEDQLTKEKLFNHYYTYGIEQLDQSINSGYKIPAQRAYSSFIKANEYGDFALDSLAALCVDYGTLVYHVDAGAIFQLSQEWEIDRMFENVTRESGRFLQVFYNTNVRGIDCGLEVDFGSLDFRIVQNRETLNFEQEVQDGFRSETDTLGQTIRIPIYRTVSGGVVINRQKRIGEWAASVRVRAYTRNCGLQSRDFASRSESEAVEYEIFGDERAVPDEYRRGGEGNLVSEDEMAEDMLENIYSNFIGFYF